MSAASPQRAPDSPPARPAKPHIYTLETSGIIVIAVLILVLTLARYWHHIPWSPR